MLPALVKDVTPETPESSNSALPDRLLRLPTVLAPAESLIEIVPVFMKSPEPEIPALTCIVALLESVKSIPLATVKEEPWFTLISDPIDKSELTLIDPPELLLMVPPDMTREPPSPDKTSIVPVFVMLAPEPRSRAASSDVVELSRIVPALVTAPEIFNAAEPEAPRTSKTAPVLIFTPPLTVIIFSVPAVRNSAAPPSGISGAEISPLLACSTP